MKPYYRGKWNCDKYGHIVIHGSQICQFCGEVIPHKHIWSKLNKICLFCNAVYEEVTV